MKKVIKIMGTVLLVTAMAVPAFGWGRGTARDGKGMRGHGLRNFAPCDLTEEQEEKLLELQEKFIDETSPLRDEIIKKGIDLRAVLTNDNPDINKAKDIQKDISDLEAKLAQIRIEHMIEVKKINPDCPLYGRGMGGMRGAGAGSGPFGY